LGISYKKVTSETRSKVELGAYGASYFKCKLLNKARGGEMEESSNKQLRMEKGGKRKVLKTSLFFQP